MNRYLNASNSNAKIFTQPLLVTTGTVFKDLSGKFVYNNGGALSLATGAVEIFGYDETGERTSVAGEKHPIQKSCDVPYWLPVKRTAGAFTEANALALIGKTINCVIESYIQKADLDSADGVGLVIEGYDVTNQLIKVSMNPARTRTAAVTE